MFFKWIGSVVILVVLLVSNLRAQSPSFIRVSDDGKGFVFADSGKPFIPWGVNYDHDESESGRLIEDYWDSEWPKVEEDLREIRELGANAVRIHLQFGRFMTDANTANEKSLDKLDQLLKLAEQLGLYLDLTGLGCYHKPDVPAWYDQLDEKQRWAAQAKFWEAVAQRCAKSPAVFCYDLMNEPVVPGGSRPRGDWLGPDFAGKYFVQFITLEQGERKRPDIARAWIETLAAAIRRHDNRHLITVGLVDWSLERPGLTSGFVPKTIAPPLDFLCVHIYPSSGKVSEAIETLKGFQVDKPVVIEETFPLSCSAAELETFIEQSRGNAAGWFGFYWGKTAAQYREGNEFLDKIMLTWLDLFQRLAPK